MALPLWVLTGALLMVAFISDTLVRHLVQIIPVISVMVLARYRPRLGAAGAIPIFVFWLGISVLMALSLLRGPSVSAGGYFLMQALCTLALAIAGWMGVRRSWSTASSLSLPARGALILTFAVVQQLAVLTSSQSFSLFG